MLSYIWPIALVVCCNTIYQFCTKSVPASLDPFASLTVTYLVGAAVSTIMYYLVGKGGNILREATHLNWAPFVLGIVIVGLEVGFIFAYKAGWQVSMASTVQSSFLAIVLLIAGFLAYGEAITLNKVIGIVIVLVGLFFLNK